MQLAVALRAISPAEPLIAVLDTFGPRYQEAVAEAFAWRLGVVLPGHSERVALLEAVEAALRTADAPPDRLFFDWFGGHVPAAPGPELDGVRAAIAAAMPRKPRDHRYWSGEAPCTLLIDEVEAIWTAIYTADDWAPFHAKIAAIRAMGEALA